MKYQFGLETENCGKKGQGYLTTGSHLLSKGKKGFPTWGHTTYLI